MRIGVVDLKLGNIGSIVNMLEKLDAGTIIVTSKPEELVSIDKLILPGVGAFDRAMKNIRTLNMRETLEDLALHKRIPVLGICLGMQLLTKSSVEGIESGLGWVNAKTVKFSGPEVVGKKIPNMGWRFVATRGNSPLFTECSPHPRFYFVHSYHVSCDDQNLAIGTAEYGVKFTAALQSENIFGVQFHPEKSHRFGKEIFQSFLRI